MRRLCRFEPRPTGASVRSDRFGVASLLTWVSPASRVRAAAAMKNEAGNSSISLLRSSVCTRLRVPPGLG